MCCVCTVLFSFKSQLDGGEMCCVCTVLFSFKSQLDGEKCAVFAQYFLRSRASSTGRNVMCPRASSTGRNVLCLHNIFSFKSQLDGEKCAVFAQYFSRSRAPLARAPFERFNERAAHRPKSRISYD